MLAGPFARLRMQAEVGADARVGNFVEMKKARFGKGSKSQRLTYLGDTHIGAGSVVTDEVPSDALALGRAGR